MHRWGAALALVRERNAERILEHGEVPEDDVTSLLHVYCKGLAQTHPGMYLKKIKIVNIFSVISITSEF